MKGLFQKSMLLEEFQKVAEMISTVTRMLEETTDAQTDMISKEKLPDKHVIKCGSLLGDWGWQGSSFMLLCPIGLVLFLFKSCSWVCSIMKVEPFDHWNINSVNHINFEIPYSF